MLPSFHIENFRGFDRFDIGGLRRINLIGGRNNVGKTSLLEALYVHASPTEPFAIVDLARLREPWNRVATQDRDHACRLAFSTMDPTKTILLCPEAKADRDSLRLTMEAIPPGTPFHPSDGSPIKVPGIPSQLKAEYHSGTGEVTRSNMTLWMKGAEITDYWGLRLPNFTDFLPPSPSIGTTELERFSALISSGDRDLLVETVRILDPRIAGLEILFRQGVSEIHCDVGDRKLPISVMGEGLARVLILVLSIAKAPGRRICIDEFENGIHHAALPDVWKAVGAAAKRWDTQVFATTHSWECVVAAAQAFNPAEEQEFAYHRLDRRPEGIRATTYDREALEGAIEGGIEVR